MTVSEPRGRCCVSWVGLLAVWAGVALAAGCGPSTPAGLLVATSWPLDERVRLQSEFHQWLPSSGLDLGHEPIRLEWLVLAPGDDIERVARRRSPPDVLLGGRGASLEHLSRAERLLPVAAADSVRWCVTRRTDAGLGRSGDPRADALRIVVGLAPARAGSMAGGLCPPDRGRRA